MMPEKVLVVSNALKEIRKELAELRAERERINLEESVVNLQHQVVCSERITLATAISEAVAAIKTSNKYLKEVLEKVAEHKKRIDELGDHDLTCMKAVVDVQKRLETLETKEHGADQVLRN